MSHEINKDQKNYSKTIVLELQDLDVVDVGLAKEKWSTPSMSCPDVDFGTMSVGCQHD